MKPAAVVAIIAVLVGVGAGYLAWGAKSQQLETEVAGVRAQLADAQKAAVREGQMATKIQEIEAQSKKATEDLKTEEDARAKLEKLAARLKPKKK